MELMVTRSVELKLATTFTPQGDGNTLRRALANEAYFSLATTFTPQGDGNLLLKILLYTLLIN